VLLLSADDGSLVNRVILDHSPAVMFVTSGSDGTNDIIWAESGALFDSQQSTGTSPQLCVPVSHHLYSSLLCRVRVAPCLSNTQVRRSSGAWTRTSSATPRSPYRPHKVSAHSPVIYLFIYLSAIIVIH
jgi:hypothetical protein